MNICLCFNHAHRFYTDGILSNGIILIRTFRSNSSFQFSVCASICVKVLCFKMNLKFVYFFIFLCIILQMQSDAYETIGIEPQEVRRTKNQLIISKCYEFSIAVSQYIGVTVSLVAANLITAMLETKPISIMQTYTPSKNNIIKPSSRTCKNEFGCDDNICWRSCPAETDDHKKNGSFSWCFASPNPNNHKFEHCDHNYECSPCWSCLGACQSEDIGSYIVNEMIEQKKLFYSFVFVCFRCMMCESIRNKSIY